MWVFAGKYFTVSEVWGLFFWSHCRLHKFHASLPSQTEESIGHFHGDGAIYCPTMRITNALFGIKWGRSPSLQLTANNLYDCFPLTVVIYKYTISTCLFGGNRKSNGPELCLPKSCLSCWLYDEAKKSFVLWCLSLRFGGVYWVQVVMEYLIIAFVLRVIINMLYWN